MNRKLPEFPRIPRFITEEVISVRTLSLLKLVVVGLVSLTLLYQIILEGIALPHYAAQAALVQVDKEKFDAEITHWKKIADQYAGYRDVYYRIAFLQYKKGNIEEAKAYLQKAMEVDPNFDAGRVLGEKIKL